MSDDPYVAVFESSTRHVAYAAATLNPLPDVFGSGTQVAASLEEKEAWSLQTLRPHDDFTQAILDCRTLRGISMRVTIRPDCKVPVSVAYCFRAAGRTEQEAERRVQDVWSQVKSAYPRHYFTLTPIRQRTAFDTLLDFDTFDSVVELQPVLFDVALTQERSIDVAIPFADYGLRWNSLIGAALNARRALCIDINLTRTRLAEEELDELARQVQVCRAVYDVTRSELAHLVGGIVNTRLKALRQNSALGRVAVAVAGEMPSSLQSVLNEAFACGAEGLEERWEPVIEQPAETASKQRLLESVAYLLPPVGRGGEQHGTDRWSWLLSGREASMLFRPPILVSPEYPQLEFAVPDALEEVLSKTKVVNVSGGVYVEKMRNSRITADFHQEHIGGDHVGGSKVAGDQVEGNKMGDVGLYKSQDASGSTPNAPGTLCGKCGRDVGVARFCPHCGTRIRCPACNNILTGSPRFCPECGEPLKSDN